MARKPTAGTLAPAVRPDLGLTLEETDLSAVAVETFTVALGGREALLETLAVADGSPDVHKVTNLLLDPRYDGWSLRRICALAGLTVADLFVAYRQALVTRAHLQAAQVVASHLVAVVDDVMRRAQPQEIVCTACNGTAHVTPEPTKTQPNPSPQPCQTCRATGKLIQLPDLDRQKVALELGHLLQQRGITLQQNNLTLPGGGGPAALTGSLEQLQQAVHGTLYGRRGGGGRAPAEAPIETETVESIENPATDPPRPSP